MHEAVRHRMFVFLLLMQSEMQPSCNTAPPPPPALGADGLSCPPTSAAEGKRPRWLSVMSCSLLKPSAHMYQLTASRI